MTDYPPKIWAGRERIEACLQACDGIPTDALKRGAVKALVEAATNLNYDEIKAALAPFRQD